MACSMKRRVSAAAVFVSASQLDRGSGDSVRGRVKALRYAHVVIPRRPR